MVMRLILLSALLLLNTTALARGLTASVDRTQLGLGEQLELTITLTDIKGKRPDTRALLQDFTVDRQTQSSQTQIINGVVDQTASWIYLLSPIRKGKLIIPVFMIDRFSSDPIEITVTDMPVAQSTSDDVLMEVAVSPASPYVQSQVAYIQRLYFSRPLVDRAAISRPKLSKGEADIQYWGASDARYVTHNNRPYQLIERYYIIYPSKAGELEFEPSAFNGSLASSRQRNNFRMNMFRNGTSVSAYSKKVTLMIKEKPANYTAEHWLPATQVTLNMNLSQRPETLKAGEPLTITIALLAEGLKAEVLPEVKLDLPADIKSYPEKPTFRTDKVTNGMVGQRQEKLVLIANKDGEYVIPEVQIPWWSVTEDKLKIAKLDSVVLKVTGGAPSDMKESDSTPSAAADADGSERDNEAIDEQISEDEKAENVEPAKEEAESLLTTFRSGVSAFYQQNKRWLLIALLLITGLLGLAWAGLRRRKSHNASTEYQRQIAIDDALQALEYPCKRYNPQAAIAALSKWAEVVGIYPATLSGIEAAGDANLSAEVRKLTEANYSQDAKEVWDGESLYKAASQYSHTNQVRQSDSSVMQPLHPVSS